VGLPAENICFPPILMAAREVRIHASTIGTRQDLREVLAMAAAGKIRCHVVKRPIAEANEALDLCAKAKSPAESSWLPKGLAAGIQRGLEFRPAHRRHFRTTIALPPLNYWGAR
jgi:hypothetical protein